MPATYEPIATTTLSSAAASITFSSISSAYTDLRVVIVPITADNTGTSLRINSDTNTNYSRTLINGNGTTAASVNATNADRMYLTYSDPATSQPRLITIDFFSYAGSTYKTCLSTDANDKNGSGMVLSQVGLWRSTSAITSISFLTNTGGNFNTGTTATLYGIKAA